MDRSVASVLVITIVIILLVGILGSTWVALSIAIILLGTIGYLERIFPFKLSFRFRICLLISFLFCSLSLLIITALEKSSSNRLKADVTTLKEYGEVAKWNFDGGTVVGGGVSVGGPVGNWHHDYLKREGDGISWKCTDDALTHYKSIIRDHPRYPFPYYLLAACLKKSGDNSWKTLAENGISILEQTTKVPGHDPAHDDLLKRLREFVSE